MLSSSTQESTAKAPALDGTSQPPSGYVTSKPNYNPFSARTTSHPSSRTSTPGPSLSFSKPAPVSQTSQSPQPPQSDPFALLASPPARQASPMINAPPSNIAHPSPSASIFNFAPSAPGATSTTQSSGPSQRSNGATADDDWDFASALPDDHAQLPPVNDLTLSKTSVTIAFKISRPNESDSVVNILAQSSNNTEALITDYTFQVAVKVDQHHRSCICFRPRLIYSHRVLRFGSPLSPGAHSKRIRKMALRKRSRFTAWPKGRPARSRCGGKRHITSWASCIRSKGTFRGWESFDSTF